MRFLFDQSTDYRLVPHLKALGHDVTAIDVDYPGSLPDPEVLAIARDEQRVLVTDDSDFGELIFRHGEPHAGVIFLRLGPTEMALKLERLLRVLEEHSHELTEFIVVTKQRIRVRRRSHRL